MIPSTLGKALPWQRLAMLRSTEQPGEQQGGMGWQGEAAPTCPPASSPAPEGCLAPAELETPFLKAAEDKKP